MTPGGDNLFDPFERDPPCCSTASGYSVGSKTISGR